MQSQITCNGCRSLLLYPRGASNVCCALCNTITSVPAPPPAMDMAQLVCRGCRTLLMYTRGASSVRCSCCHTLNLPQAHINCGNCRTTLMYPSGAPSVKCAICQYITNVCKPELPQSSNPLTKRWTLLVVRLAAFLAAAAAALVMALNKQSINFVVATIGTTSIKATVSAKFYHTPAFIFFVIANGMASFHSLVMVGVDIFANKFDYKGLRLPIIAILDMMTVCLVSGGVNGVLFMAELGKNGNSHAKWDKICDKFGTFCNHGAGALIASFIALLLLLLISAISTLNLLKSSKPTSS